MCKEGRVQVQENFEVGGSDERRFLNNERYDGARGHEGQRRKEASTSGGQTCEVIRDDVLFLLFCVCSCWLLQSELLCWSLCVLTPLSKRRIPPESHFSSFLQVQSLSSSV
jgi:hypothetical protein